MQVCERKKIAYAHACTRKRECVCICWSTYTMLMYVCVRLCVWNACVWEKLCMNVCVRACVWEKERERQWERNHVRENMYVTKVKSIYLCMCDRKICVYLQVWVCMRVEMQMWERNDACVHTQRWISVCVRDGENTTCI